MFNFEETKANLLECAIFHGGFMESSPEGRDFSVHLNGLCLCCEPGGGQRSKANSYTAGFSQK